MPFVSTTDNPRSTSITNRTLSKVNIKTLQAHLLLGRLVMVRLMTLQDQVLAQVPGSSHHLNIIKTPQETTE